MLGGGGGGLDNLFFFCRKTILSHFTFYAIFNIKIKYWKVPLHLLVKWEVVSPNSSRWGQLESISIMDYPLFPCSDFVSQMWGGGGGVGVMFFSHFMLFPTFLEKNIWEYKTIISHLMFSSCFFLYAGNIEKCPVHLQLLVKWEAVSPNSRYIGNFIMRLEILKSASSLTG